MCSSNVTMICWCWEIPNVKRRGDGLYTKRPQIKITSEHDLKLIFILFWVSYDDSNTFQIKFRDFSMTSVTQTILVPVKPSGSYLNNEFWVHKDDIFRNEKGHWELQNDHKLLRKICSTREFHKSRLFYFYWKSQYMQ